MTAFEKYSEMISRRLLSFEFTVGFRLKWLPTKAKKDSIPYDFTKSEAKKDL